jgi:hypothetical protein
LPPPPPDTVEADPFGLPAHMRGWEAGVNAEFREGVLAQLQAWQKFALRVRVRLKPRFYCMYQLSNVSNPPFIFASRCSSKFAGAWWWRG